MVGEFFLSHVVRQPAAVDSHRTRQHQGRDGGAIQQVVVVPVIGARADDDQIFSVRLFGIDRPLARIAQAGVAVNAAELFLPGGGIARFIIVGFGIVACQSALHAELCHHQIEDGRNGDFALAGFNRSHRDPAPAYRTPSEIIEFDLRDRLVLVEEG